MGETCEETVTLTQHPSSVLHSWALSISDWGSLCPKVYIDPVPRMPVHALQCSWPSLTLTCRSICSEM